jgi:Pentatricopeptide repeat domain
MKLSRRVYSSCRSPFENSKLENGPKYERNPIRRCYSSNLSNTSTKPLVQSQQEKPLSLPALTLTSLLGNDPKIPTRPSATKWRATYKEELQMYAFKHDLHSLKYDKGPSIRHIFSLRVFPVLSQQPSRPPTSEEIAQLNDTLGPIDGPVPDEAHPMKPLEELEEGVLGAHEELTEILGKYKDRLPEDVPMDRIFALYESLPGTRLCYLSRLAVRRIFSLLSRQNNHLNSTVNRYMLLIKDMQNNRTRIRLSEWTGLIDSIGKCFLFDESQRVELAIEALSDMEQSGIKPDIAALTSLLQVSVRHNNHRLTEMIESEIQKRKLDKNIALWTTRIKQAGLHSNVEKVHQTFREFCKTGIPVDIVFVNAVLEAFLNVKRPHLAELVYLRLRGFVMTCYKDEKFPRRGNKITIRHERRDFLSAAAAERRRGWDLDQEIARRRIDPQDLYYRDGTPTALLKSLINSVAMNTTPQAAKLIPQYGTLRLFISYHSHYTGRMADIAFYLNDMDIFNVTPKYGTYVDILHAFFLWHVPGGQWNAERLENVFSIIRNGVMAGKPPFPITYAIALTSIRAYGRVLGGKSAREVWELLKPWLVINENVRETKQSRILKLEELVNAFEAGHALSHGMMGGEVAYRVIDWRTY